MSSAAARSCARPDETWVWECGALALLACFVVAGVHATPAWVQAQEAEEARSTEVSPVDDPLERSDDGIDDQNEEGPAAEPGDGAARQVEETHVDETTRHDADPLGAPEASRAPPVDGPEVGSDAVGSEAIASAAVADVDSMAGSLDAAQEVLRLEMELETVQMNPLFFFGGGFISLAGIVGTGVSVGWLSDAGDNVDGPAALLVVSGVVAAAGLTLVALGIVDKIDVDARRTQLQRRRARLGTPATGMFRLGLGADGEVRIR